MRKELQDWFEQALAENKTAKHCLKSGDYYAAAFHAQQAMELGLKALYIYQHNEYPPKIHNLLELVTVVKLPKKFVSSAEELSPAYMLARYPDVAGGVPYKQYSEQKAQQLIRKMEDFVKWLKDCLKK